MSPNSHSIARNRICRGLAYCLSMALLATLASGCQDTRLSDYEAVALNDPTVAHPIAFASERETLVIELPPRGGHLSQNQYADAYRFVRRFRSEAKGDLTISLPRHAAGAGATLDDLGSILREVEVDRRQVRKTYHHGGRRDAGTVKVSFVRPVAVPPECGNWGRNVIREWERVPYPQWGCATQRNIAGMVANARDLQRPQPEDPRAAERRQALWSKYIVPEPGSTGSGGSDEAGKATATSAKK